MRLVALSWFLIVVGSACTLEHGQGGFSDGGNPPPGSVCGGFANQQCGPTEFCDFDRDGCGAADESGTCRPRPTGCPDNFDPVCGCDGQVHSNACDASAAGIDVNANGTCPVDAGRFACGFRTCDLMTEYCEHGFSDIGSEPDSFTCKPLPACPSQFPSCGCMTAEPCGSMCSGTATTGLTLTCPGG
jgi:hypothetical protein